MDSESSAQAAIQELNGHEMGGRRMKVEMSVGVNRDQRRGKTTQKLFIGNVADGTTDQQLRGVFADLCPVVEADVIDGKNFGFVHIDIESSPGSYDGRLRIEQIINQVNGAEVNGNRLRIQASTNERERGGGRGGRGRGGGRGGRDGGRGGGFGGGRGGGRGRRDAPYPSRGGYNGGYNGGYDGGYHGGYNGGYDGYGSDYYGGGGGGGPMRGGDYYGDYSAPDRDYGGYGGGSSGMYPEPMYSRRPAAQQRPRGGRGFNNAGYAGGGGLGAPYPPPQASYDSYGYSSSTPSYG